MPTRQKLESALRNADAAGDMSAARQLANALKAGQFDDAALPVQPEQEPVSLQMLPEPRKSTQAMERSAQPEQPADLPKEEGGFLQGVSDFFTGNDRETRATKELPSIMDMGLSNLLGDVSATQKATATAGLAATMDPQGQIEIIRANADGPVSVAQDEEGNTILNVNGRLAILNKPGVDLFDAFQGAAQVAAFTPAGAYAGRSASVMGQAARGAAASGVTQAGLASAGSAAGRDVSGEEVLEESATAAMFGGVAPAVFKALASAGRPISKVIKEALGQQVPAIRQIQVFSPDGAFSDDAIREVTRAGVNPSEMDHLVRGILKRDDILTPEQIGRFNLFERTGVQPTRANLTQSANDFQAQQEAIKRSGALRTAVDNQDRQLTEAVDDVAARTGDVTGDAYDAGESVFQAVTQKANKLDEKINQLYGQARATAQDEKVVALSSLRDAIKTSTPQNQVSNGVVRAVAGDLRQRGVLGQGLALQGKINVNTAEEVRKSLNHLRAGANPSAKRIIDQFKEALDKDVLRTAGRDAFKESRKAYSDFKSELSLTRRSKFDQSSGSIVEDILLGKIEPEQLLKKAVVNSSASVRDLGRLKSYLHAGPEDQIQAGKQAWSNLQGQTVRHMLEKAIGTAGRGEGGQAVFNGNQFRKEMHRIGKQKLRIMLGDDFDKLEEIAEVGRLRIPITMTQQGQGPSAQAISELSGQLPIISSLVRVGSSVKDAVGQRAAVNPARATEEAFRDVNKVLRMPRPSGTVLSGEIVGAQEAVR